MTTKKSLKEGWAREIKIMDMLSIILFVIGILLIVADQLYPPLPPNILFRIAYLTIVGVFLIILSILFWMKKAKPYKPVAGELSELDLEKMPDKELDELSFRARAELDFRDRKDEVLKMLKEACISEASGEEKWLLLIHDDLCLIIKKTKENEGLLEKIFGKRAK